MERRQKTLFALLCPQTIKPPISTRKDSAKIPSSKSQKLLAIKGIRTYGLSESAMPIKTKKCDKAYADGIAIINASDRWKNPSFQRTLFFCNWHPVS